MGLWHIWLATFILLPGMGRQALAAQPPDRTHASSREARGDRPHRQATKAPGRDGLTAPLADGRPVPLPSPPAQASNADPHATTITQILTGAWEHVSAFRDRSAPLLMDPEQVTPEAVSDLIELHFTKRLGPLVKELHELSTKDNAPQLLDLKRLADVVVSYAGILISHLYEFICILSPRVSKEFPRTWILIALMELGRIRRMQNCFRVPRSLPVPIPGVLLHADETLFGHFRWVECIIRATILAILQGSDRAKRVAALERACIHLEEPMALLFQSATKYLEQIKTVAKSLEDVPASDWEPTVGFLTRAFDSEQLQRVHKSFYRLYCLARFYQMPQLRSQLWKHTMSLQQLNLWLITTIHGIEAERLRKLAAPLLKDRRKSRSSAPAGWSHHLALKVGEILDKVAADLADFESNQLTMSDPDERFSALSKLVPFGTAAALLSPTVAQPEAGATKATGPDSFEKLQDRVRDFVNQMALTLVEVRPTLLAPYGEILTSTNLYGRYLKYCKLLTLYLSWNRLSYALEVVTQQEDISDRRLICSADLSSPKFAPDQPQPSVAPKKAPVGVIVLDDD